MNTKFLLFSLKSLIALTFFITIESMEAPSKYRKLSRELETAKTSEQYKKALDSYKKYKKEKEGLISFKDYPEEFQKDISLEDLPEYLREELARQHGKDWKDIFSE